MTKPSRSASNGRDARFGSSFRVESARIEAKPADLCEFLREYLAEKYDEIDLAGFSLRVAIPDAPVRVLLDPLAFRHVLDNLLSNSLRYNRLGTVLFFELRAQGSSAVLLIGVKMRKKLSLSSR